MADARTAVQAPPQPGARCGYVGCPELATMALRSKYGRAWWRGCPQHWPAMHDALYIGQPTDSGQVTLRKVS